MDTTEIRRRPLPVACSPSAALVKPPILFPAGSSGKINSNYLLSLSRMMLQKMPPVLAELHVEQMR